MAPDARGAGAGGGVPRAAASLAGVRVESNTVDLCRHVADAVKARILAHVGAAHDVRPVLLAIEGDRIRSVDGTVDIAVLDAVERRNAGEPA